MASSSNNDRSSSFPIFDGENYDYWRVKMRTLFTSYGLWKFVDTRVVKPKEEAELTVAERALVEENLKKDAKALYLIQMGLSKGFFPRISNETKAKDAWDVLEKEFRDYFTRLTDDNQLKSYGEELSDRRIIEKILISLLPQRYDSMVNVIEGTKYLNSLTIQELKGSLQAFDQRLNRHAEYSVESAFQTLTMNSKGKEQALSSSQQSKPSSNKSNKNRKGKNQNAKGKNSFEKKSN
ncbi:uncharacterized protein LOC110768444 [Prunus avium]|uniref:Uncharacterized protein LOC110768444 n=1 Tax=Prunus avium TaxID=42229 RepID=A0A6P5TLK8_PRUAV|nr:uncharacterized protein LOC110768444 [Prunus avium]